MHNHIDAVALMLENGARNYDDALYSAAISGYVDIVKLMLETGANNYDEAILHAKTKEIKTMIKYYQNKNKNL